MIRKQIVLLIPILFHAAIFVGCKKSDIENQTLTVSRLYISNSDTARAVANITVFDPADANPFPSAYSYLSKAPAASGILFDPSSGTVFQVGRQNKVVKSFAVSPFGILSDKSSFVDSSLNSPRDIAYNRLNRDTSFLYVSSDLDKAIYVYNNPANLSGSTVKPSKKFTLDGKPWGIYSKGDSLMVVMEDLNKREIQLYLKVSKLASGEIRSINKIIINGATRLHGITYSAKQDLLIVTDIGLENNPSDGKIYIIEGANAKFLANAAISPTRTINGVNTTLGDPFDVAYDDRADKNLIYVADKINKKVLVFRLGDTGDVSPMVIQNLANSPEAIYLDAR